MEGGSTGAAAGARSGGGCRVPGPSCLSWVSVTRPRAGKAKLSSYRQSTDNQDSDNVWREPPEDSSWTPGKPSSLLETTATVFMAGVLWTMQLLNYPLLALVGADAFPRYEAAHNRRFALVVVPGVLAAAAGGIGLVAVPARPGPAVGAGLRAGAAAGRDHFHGSATGPPASGAGGRLRRAGPQPACPLQLDKSSRLVSRGRYRAVDVPPGVHAMSGPAPGLARPPGAGDHDQRHRASPATRRKLEEGSA